MQNFGRDPFPAGLNDESSPVRRGSLACYSRERSLPMKTEHPVARNISDILSPHASHEAEQKADELYYLAASFFQSPGRHNLPNEKPVSEQYAGASVSLPQAFMAPFNHLELLELCAKQNLNEFSCLEKIVGNRRHHFISRY
jgi:hypothetical protein